MKEVIKSEGVNLVTMIGDVLIGVPLVGTAVSIGKVYQAYNEQMFESKLRAFLRESTVDKEVASKFKLSLKGDEQSFYKKLWTLIDRLDSDEKATIVGKMFRRVLNNDLTVDEFLEASDAVNRIYIGYIKMLQKEYLLGNNKGASNLHIRSQLIREGLIIESDDPAPSSNHLKKAQLSSIGKILSGIK